MPLAFLRSLREVPAEAAAPLAAAESSLAKDWLTPEEDAAWADLWESTGGVLNFPFSDLIRSQKGARRSSLLNCLAMTSYCARSPARRELMNTRYR